MHEHISFRDRLATLAEQGTTPAFESTEDPILVSFAQLFLDSRLVAFDANRHLRTDALSPIFDCSTESLAEGAGRPEVFVVIWTPVWDGDDPVTGFRTGQDSAFVGSTATVAMPQDERTAALLLLVTSTFVHLSAAYDDGVLVVRGAAEGDDQKYRYLSLDHAAIARLSLR